MKKLVDKIFRRYGVEMMVQKTAGPQILSGFVQRAATSARKYMLPEYSPLGELPVGHYVFLLPLDYVRMGELVMYNGRWHIVRRIERVWLGKTALYDWCLCEQRGEADKWGK